MGKALTMNRLIRLAQTTIFLVLIGCKEDQESTIYPEKDRGKEHTVVEEVAEGDPPAYGVNARDPSEVRAIVDRLQKGVSADELVEEFGEPDLVEGDWWKYWIWDYRLPLNAGRVGFNGVVAKPNGDANISNWSRFFH